jgi:hypothetical protein
MAIELDNFKKLKTTMEEMITQKDAQLEDLKQKLRNNIHSEDT